MDTEYCVECGSEDLTLDRKMELRTRFQEAHRKGAERFGGKWLTVNQCAVDAAAVLDIDASDVRIKALLSEACYRILATMFTEKEVGTI